MDMPIRCFTEKDVPHPKMEKFSFTMLQYLAQGTCKVNIISVVFPKLILVSTEPILVKHTKFVVCLKDPNTWVSKPYANSANLQYVHRTLVFEFQ